MPRVNVYTDPPRTLAALMCCAIDVVDRSLYGTENSGTWMPTTGDRGRRLHGGHRAARNATDAGTVRRHRTLVGHRAVRLIYRCCAVR